MTEVDIVDYILDQNEELKNTYYLYQNILYSLQYKDYDNISEYMKNALEQPYNNGNMERNNNTYKLIKSWI